MGCGVAALAMATGMTYDKVASYFVLRDFRKHGMIPNNIDHFLFDHGFVMCRVSQNKDWTWEFPNRVEHKQLWEFWPPKPFAPAHIAQVVQKMTGNLHFIVLDDKGKIFDPLGIAKTYSDYRDVLMVTGIWKRETK